MFIRDNQAMLPSGINHWLTDRKLKIEIGLTLLSSIGILIHSFEKEVGGDMVVISMSAQAVFYIILAYTTPDMEGQLAHLMFKVISLSSAMSINGLLFSVLRFDGAKEMMLIGFSAMSGASVILLYYVFKQWNDKLRPLSIRVFVLLVLTSMVRFDIVSF